MSSYVIFCCMLQINYKIFHINIFIFFQNGTFIGPTLSVPIMMFSGFGVSIKDLPVYLKWGSYISYLRYAVEGYMGAIYGDRPNLQCHTHYCHYIYPNKFLKEVDWTGDKFWIDFSALVVIVLICRVSAFILLKWKLIAIRQLKVTIKKKKKDFSLFFYHKGVVYSLFLYIF